MRKKTPKSVPKTLKKMIPWKFLMKISLLPGLIYVAYNYTDFYIN
jgi:hypothetical protein